MATSARPARRSRRRNPDLLEIVTTALDDMKAVNVRKLDVRSLTDVADALVIASGNSDRHVRAIAEHVVEAARAAGHRPYGVEGRRDSEWVLVDLQDVVVHVMLPRTREFYQLEQLWEAAPAARPAASATRPAARKAGAGTGKAGAATRAAGKRSVMKTPPAKSARKAAPPPRARTAPAAGGTASVRRPRPPRA